MCYDYTLFFFDSIITCETNHCHNTGCYRVGKEWICFECLLAMDKRELQTEMNRVNSELDKTK